MYLWSYSAPPNHATDAACETKYRVFGELPNSFLRGEAIITFMLVGKLKQMEVNFLTAKQDFSPPQMLHAHLIIRKEAYENQCML